MPEVPRRPGGRPELPSRAAGAADARVPPRLPWVVLGGVAGAGLSLMLTWSVTGRGTPGLLETDAVLAWVLLTSAANALGSFALGLLRGRHRASGLDPRVEAALGTGLLGSFTSFTVLTAVLGGYAVLIAGAAAQAGWWAPVALWLAVLVAVLLASIAAGTAAAAAGLVLGRGGHGSAEGGRP